MEERYVSTGKAARLAKVSFATIKRMIYAGRLRAEKNPVGRWCVARCEACRGSLEVRNICQGIIARTEGALGEPGVLIEGMCR